MIEKLEPNFFNPATGTKFYDNNSIVEKLNSIIEELNRQTLELKMIEQRINSKSYRV